MSITKLIFILILLVLASAGLAKAETVVDVFLTNAVFPPKSPAGTIIGDLSAATLDGSPFQGSFAVQSSGSSPRGTCRAENGTNFKIINTGPGAAHLEVLNPSIGPGPWPASYSYGYQYYGYFCIAAIPVSGTPFVRSFLLMAQGRKITAVTPTSVSYTLDASSGSVLANFSAVASDGSTTTPSWSLAPDCSGADIVMKPTGELDVGPLPLTGEIKCHVVASQTGVANSPLKWPVTIYPGTYSGPADVGGAYAGWALSAVSSSAAEAGAPAFRVSRDNDHQQMDITVLPNGDLDLATAATFCAPTICEGRVWYDQVGKNDLMSWAQKYSTSLATGHNPLLVFNAQEANPNTWGPGASGSLPAWSFSNGNDRLWFKPTLKMPPLTSATIAAVGIASTYDGLIANSNFSNVYSLGASLYFRGNTGVGIGVGKLSSLTVIQGPATPSAWHVMQGIINGSASAQYIDTSPSITGDLPTYPYISNNFYVGGDFGGGGMNGFLSEVLLLPTETSDQANAVCYLAVPWAC